MKISKINIQITEKYFLEYKGLDYEDRKTKLNKDLKEFLDKTKDIQVIETGEISNVYRYGEKDDDDNFNTYSGYFVKYYEGLMVIDGRNIFMNIALNKRIMELALKEAGSEIKKLVEQEYNEFENQLDQLIDKTKSKSKKIKNTVLNNLNKK